MSSLNLKVNVPFIVEQSIHENNGHIHDERYAYVVLEEQKETATYGYRLANLTLGVLRPPVFRTIQDVEHYIEARVTWKVLQEDIEYGFDTSHENENER